MLEIPPAKDTDAEDVVWGLQTADTLWKRGERIDALVWLRRAAQAAGDANDDDRALELARHAAELTEWMASSEDDHPVTSVPPARRAPPLPPSSTNREPTYPDVPSIVQMDHAEETGRPSATSVLPAEKVHAGMFDPWADQSSQLAPPSAPAKRPAVPPPAPPRPPTVPAVDVEEEIVTSVRPQ
ncbi:MAG TPA: hypothetical protein VM925_37875, partial [Labilithrix sp.]|nr:hypothetical protein [Labilithrix sp.]